MEIGIRHMFSNMSHSYLLIGGVFLKCWDLNFRFHSRLWRFRALFSMCECFLIFINLDASVFSMLTTFLCRCLHPYTLRVFSAPCQSLESNKTLLMCFFFDSEWGICICIKTLADLLQPWLQPAQSEWSLQQNMKIFAKERLAPAFLMAYELLLLESYFLAKMYFHAANLELPKGNFFFSFCF